MLPPPYVLPGGVTPLLPITFPAMSGLTKVPATYFWAPDRVSEMSTSGVGVVELF